MTFEIHVTASTTHTSLLVLAWIIHKFLCPWLLLGLVFLPKNSELSTGRELDKKCVTWTIEMRMSLADWARNLHPRYPRCWALVVEQRRGPAGESPPQWQKCFPHVHWLDAPPVSNDRQSPLVAKETKFKNIISKVALIISLFWRHY